MSFPAEICLTSENSFGKLREVEGNMAGIALILFYPLDFYLCNRYSSECAYTYILSIGAASFNKFLQSEQNALCRGLFRNKDLDPDVGTRFCWLSGRRCKSGASSDQCL